MQQKHDPQVGDVFGKLVVIDNGYRFDPAPAHRAKGKPGDRGCVVRCECGREWPLRTAQLFAPTWPTKACRRCRPDLHARAYPVEWQRKLITSYFGSMARRAGYPTSFAGGAEFADHIQEALGIRPEGAVLRMIDRSLGLVPGNFQWVARQGDR